MQSIVFTFIVGFIGYLVQDGTFGMKLINAFEWLNVMYFIILMLVGTITTIFIVIAIIGGYSVTKKSTSDPVLQLLGAIGGGMIGSVLGMVVVGMSFFSYWITDKIILEIPANINSFQEIPDLSSILIYVVVTLLFALLVIGENKNG